MGGLFLGRGSACGWCDESSSESISESISESSSSAFVNPYYEAECDGCRTGKARSHYRIFPPVNFFSGDGSSCDEIADLFTDGFEIEKSNYLEQFGDFSCYWRRVVPVSGGTVWVEMKITSVGAIRVAIDFSTPVLVSWVYTLPSPSPFPLPNCLATFTVPFSTGFFNTASGCGSPNGSVTVEPVS